MKHINQNFVESFSSHSRDILETITRDHLSSYSLSGLLMAFILLFTLGVGEMRAWVMWGNLYWDNTNNNWSNVTLVIGRSGCSKGYRFAKLDNTNLYYKWVDFDDWNDLYFINAAWSDDSECNGDTPWDRVSGFSSSDRFQPFKGNYNINEGGGAIRYYFNGVHNSDVWKYIPLKTATLKVKKSTNGGAYTEITSGDWPAVINTKGTVMDGDAATKQTNFDTEDGAQAEYGSIPVTGEVTFTLGSSKTDDYVFEGWGTGDSPTASETTKTYNVTDNTTYYAFFRSPKYKVVFHSNGGTGSMEDQYLYVSAAGNLSSNSFTKTNYTFVGWSTTESGDVEYADGESVTGLGSSEGDEVDLYAVWEDEWCILGSGAEMGAWGTYNGLTYVSGTTYTGTISLAAGTTYQFKVFNRNSSGASAWYGSGDSDGAITFTRAGTTSQSGLADDKSNLAITADIDGDYTFTWNTYGNVVSVTYPTPSYNITYKDQDDVAFSGVHGSGYPTSHTYGTATDLVSPTKEGYTFGGWYANSSCTGDAITSVGATAYTADFTLYAQWTDDGTYYYKGASASGWATASNWTKGAVPVSGSNVVALTALQAPSGTTTVNSVRIATSGTYTPVGGDAIAADGSLSIPAGAALKVATSVANCTISDNAPTSGTSTTSSTLYIGAGGALVWGTSGSPGVASVGFYTVSGGTPGSKDAINEYFGIPFTSLSSDAYYNAWVFAVSGDTWAEVSGATLAPWTGYNIIEKLDEGDPAGGSYTLSGTLVSSGSSLTGGATAGSETLYANSWVAPIEISKIGFSGTGTIYMFTPSSLQDLEDADLVGDPKGNYSTITINNSKGSYIRSMQSFSAWTGTSLSIDYANAVYGEVSGAYSARRRAQAYDYRQAIWDTQDSLFVGVQSASGWGDVLKMFIHEDFSQDYENGWDGPKMEGLWEAPKLYALNNEGEMAVNCVPAAENSIIAFHAGTAANAYTLTFKYSGEEALVLRDTKTGTETPIVDGAQYAFTSESGDNDMRFVIKKAPTIATGMENLGNNASDVQKILHNGTLYIVRDGRVYSAEGTIVK